MFVFKSALPSFCGLLAMTAMACGGDDSTATVVARHNVGVH